MVGINLRKEGRNGHEVMRDLGKIRKVGKMKE